MADAEDDKRLIEAAGLSHVFELYPDDVRAALAQAQGFNQTIAAIDAPVWVPGADRLPGDGQ